MEARYELAGLQLLDQYALRDAGGGAAAQRAGRERSRLLAHNLDTHLSKRRRSAAAQPTRLGSVDCNRDRPTKPSGRAHRAAAYRPICARIAMGWRLSLKVGGDCAL